MKTDSAISTLFYAGIIIGQSLIAMLVSYYVV